VPSLGVFSRSGNSVVVLLRGQASTASAVYPTTLYDSICYLTDYRGEQIVIRPEEGSRFRGPFGPPLIRTVARQVVRNSVRWGTLSAFVTSRAVWLVRHNENRDASLRLQGSMSRWTISSGVHFDDRTGALTAQGSSALVV